MFFYYFRAKNTFHEPLVWIMNSCSELLCSCCCCCFFFLQLSRDVWSLFIVAWKLSNLLLINTAWKRKLLISLTALWSAPLSLSLSLPLCSLKALVSTGGKNVQAACDWWEQRILSLSHLLMPNGWWCPLMINISHTDPTPHAALMCHHAVYTSAALCRTLAVSLSLSLSLSLSRPPLLSHTAPRPFSSVVPGSSPTSMTRSWMTLCPGSMCCTCDPAGSFFSSSRPSGSSPASPVARTRPTTSSPISPSASSSWSVSIFVCWVTT